jgi:hypothetical protein
MPPDINPADDPQVLALTSETEQLFGMSITYAVTTPQQYAAGGEELKRVKAAQKRLDELRKSMTRPLDAAKSAIMGFFRTPEEKLARAEAGIKRAMIVYSDEQERIRREEQRKAEEAARKERERIEAIAREAERKAREKAEAERKAAEAAAAAGRAAEAAKLMAKAAATEERAAAKAEEATQQAAMVVAPVIYREPPKVSGISTREVWLFEVTDPAAVPREYLTVDESKIRKVVGALKGDTRIAGVRVYSDKRLASGAA